MLLAALLALFVPQELLTGLDGFSIENLGADVAVIGDVIGDGRDDYLAATATIAGPSEVRLISGRTRAVLLQVTPPGQLPPPPPAQGATSANNLRLAAPVTWTATARRTSWSRTRTSPWRVRRTRGRSGSTARGTGR